MEINSIIRLRLRPFGANLWTERLLRDAKALRFFVHDSPLSPFPLLPPMWRIWGRGSRKKKILQAFGWNDRSMSLPRFGTPLSSKVKRGSMSKSGEVDASIGVRSCIPASIWIGNRLSAGPAFPMEPNVNTSPQRQRLGGAVRGFASAPDHAIGRTASAARPTATNLILRPQMIELRLLAPSSPFIFVGPDWRRPSPPCSFSAVQGHCRQEVLSRSKCHNSTSLVDRLASPVRPAIPFHRCMVRGGAFTNPDESGRFPGTRADDCLPWNERKSTQSIPSFEKDERLGTPRRSRGLPPTPARNCPCFPKPEAAEILHILGLLRPRPSS